MSSPNPELVAFLDARIAERQRKAASRAIGAQSQRVMVLPPDATYTPLPSAALMPPKLPDHLDHRYEWCQWYSMTRHDMVWVRGRCKHLETVPVESIVTGETLAHLCTTCLEQTGVSV
jgi:hypothetical protein